MVLVAAFTLRALKQSFFGAAGGSAESGDVKQALVVPSSTILSTQRSTQLERITWPEKAGAALLILATLTVGLYPKLLLDRIMPAVEAMRFLKSGS